MDSRPRFLVDVMLGRLARWLRLLGYDTLYFNDVEDHELARLARAEDRVLLTRDRQLAKRRALKVLLVQNERIEAQLKEVFERLSLSAGAAFSRCPECNTPLLSRAPAEVHDRVPPYVFRTQTRFAECPNCGRIYWRGTHWAHMVERLRSAHEGQE